jgi:hypothetical protein
LMFTVVISVNSKPITKTCEASPRHTESAVSNLFDVIEVWESKLKIFKEIFFWLRD